MDKERAGKRNLMETLADAYGKEYSTKGAWKMILDALEPFRLADMEKVIPELQRKCGFMPTVADIADAIQDLEDSGQSVVSRVRSKYLNTFDFNDTITQPRLDEVLSQMGMEAGSVEAREI
jgi:hypothetical protein